jgi:two-component system, OmpR family, phosphate regulon sensor histidine kinase PhoR
LIARSLRRTPLEISLTNKLLGTSVLRILLLAAFVGGTVTAIADATWGALAAALVFFVGFIYHTRKVVQLHLWLSGEHRAADLPDGLGVWGEMLSDLYRVMRQHRVSQEALSDSLARFQQAASALPDGAVMLDIENAIVWCNPAAEAHWGIELARDRMQVITYIVRAPEFIAFLSAHQFGEAQTLRVGRMLDAGGGYEISLSIQLVAFGDDQMLLLSRDISERERLERMRSDFVANVSHELRTPLTVMAGFLETLQQPEIASGNKPELLRRSIEHMSQQTERMQRLVDDLLALSRLEDAQNKLAETVIDLYALVQASVSDAKIMSAGRHDVRTQLAPSWLVGNRDEIASVISNLIANAVRYTPTGGHIDIQLGVNPTTGDLVLSVQDDGEGIAPEHLPRLTERFYRVDRGRSRAAGGTGLGLAIVKHVLLRHGGKLEIESTQGVEVHGSTFRAIFPASRAQVEPPRPQAVAA